MEAIEQIKILNKFPTSFKDTIKETCQFPIEPGKIEILQLNITKKCNLQCKHCHVEAGPGRTEEMSYNILNKCLKILLLKKIQTLDITGGAPELNPHLEWLLNKASKIVNRIIVRTNLVILNLSNYSKFIDIYAKNNIEIFASLPDYTGIKIQRGKNFFNEAIAIIKKLNRNGYGKTGSNLILNLIHNPIGAYLPGNQNALEYEYKTKLKQNYNIDFNKLFCITNMPVGRFLDYLKKSLNIEDYFSELISSYNKESVSNVMCKNTLSVGWNGALYNCDFNQMLNMPIIISGKKNIIDLSNEDLNSRKILLHNHCFGCTAGSGSSCQGATI